MQHTHTCLQIHTCEHAQSRINPHIRVWVSDHHGDQQEKASPRSTGLPQNARPPFPKPVMCRGKQASSSILSVSLFHLKVHTVLKANSWLCTLMNANTDVDACSAQDIPNCILPRLPSESVSVPPKHTYSKRRIQWLEEFLGDGEADWNIKQASNNVSRKKKKKVSYSQPWVVHVKNNIGQVCFSHSYHLHTTFPCRPKLLPECWLTSWSNSIKSAEEI